MERGNDYFFHFLFLDNIIFFGLEHGGGSVGTGAWGSEQYFLNDLFSKHFLYDSKTLIFLYLHGSVGQGNYYLFLSLFSDNIFLWGL